MPCSECEGLCGTAEHNSAHSIITPYCDIRMTKVKTKVSGYFRSEAGARDYLKIMSYVSYVETAHKRGYSAYDSIKNAIAGRPDFIFE